MRRGSDRISGGTLASGNIGLEVEAVKILFGKLRSSKFSDVMAILSVFSATGIVVSRVGIRLRPSAIAMC